MDIDRILGYRGNYTQLHRVGPGAVYEAFDALCDEIVRLRALCRDVANCPVKYERPWESAVLLQVGSATLEAVKKESNHA